MGNVEIPNWLKELPLAPVYRPTDTEFADPIAYISKIEKEASTFGICKIIPPYPKPSKKYVFFNLNKSLLKCPELGSDVDLSKTDVGDSDNNGDVRAMFTTRQQELGQNAKRTRGSDNGNNLQVGGHMKVWRSGEIYTLEQFESKAKAFSRSQLGMIKDISPLVVEALFWKAASEKPIYIEYANDVPGSGFSEPEGHFRHFHTRRRKRGSYQRRRESSGLEGNEMGNARNASCGHETKGGPTRDDINTSPEMSEPSMFSSALPMDKDSRSSRQKSASCSSDMEGTAGWKLSNSPWNLQMIARSPGSLTRFMPDDIPGVTSPMVYIGMLFSWFAWHVEDHELHSMNFLHTGSPKTWYSVPGDYAFDFEEVIRTKAYGGNVDLLAALTVLGGKTTLVSPEMIVALGIPCCRLVQNPGEFVVTFPRAYHVGFSHGFNCGEAANFGTPQWLKVAKQAAVRRAAMNYLPMLSHQQLLYLLTMSFVSRVPRSLLPGARCSRLRDRQREEREFLVKKIFIEDMLDENKTLSLLLGSELSYRMVLWNPDSLPRHNKEPQEADVTNAGSSTPPGNVVHEHAEADYNNKKNSLLEEMRLLMENPNALYLEEEDDLLSDFQVDYGTLACVACGILGFPFMSVVQLSEKAIKDLAEKPVGSGVSDASLSSEEIPAVSSEMYENGWNTSSRYLRPRIFCLEHTVQVQKLFQAKGGVNILVICHKDYQKIRAHAAAVAQELDIPFNYNDAPLESASQEDLSLIDLAVEDEENNENGEDWTSTLGINLRYCVKAWRNSPTKQIQHMLSLSGLFCGKIPSPDFLKIKWQLRRSRSKVKFSRPSQHKPCEKNGVKVDGRLAGKLDYTSGRKEEKIIQYSRRKKMKPDCSEKHGMEEASTAKCDKLDGNVCLNNLSSDECTGMTQMQRENTVFELTREMLLLSSPLRDTGTFATAASTVRSLGHSENHNSEVSDTEGKPSHIAADNHESYHIEGTGNCSISSCLQSNGRYEVQGVTVKTSIITDGACCVVNWDATTGCSVANEVCDCMSSQDKVQQDNPAAPRSINVEPDLSCDIPAIQNTHTSMGDSCDGPRETYEDQSTYNWVVRGGIGMSNRNQEGLSLNIAATENKPLAVKIQTMNPVKEEAGPVANRQIQVDQATCSLAESSAVLAGDCPGENKTVSDELLNDSIQQVGEDQCAPSSARLGLVVPVETGESEMSIGDMTRDGEVLENKQTSTANNYDKQDEPSTENLCSSSEVCSSQGNSESDLGRERKKRRRETEIEMECKIENSTSFIRSPCEGLRPRAKKEPIHETAFNHTEAPEKEKPTTERVKKPSNVSSGHHKCNLEGCKMSFQTKEELQTHKRNRCTHEGCGKKFRAHRYVVLHQRVHNDDRPFKCPWKGCCMTFKWAWARTEHLRLHTGERPYKCKVEGCGLSFRFVSDFSRHRRKTGHYVN